MKKRKIGKTASELKKELDLYIKQSTKRLKERLQAEWQKEKTTKNEVYV